MRKQLLKRLIDIYLSRLINKIEIDCNRIEFLVVWKNGLKTYIIKTFLNKPNLSKL